LECYAAAVLWARTEGFIPAPETSHAIQCVIEEAKKAKEEGKEKVILFNWSGHGLMDLSGYDSYFGGKLVDYPLPEEEMRKSLKSIEGFPKPKMMRKGKPI
jgi:tryptophan synthase beta chain